MDRRLERAATVAGQSWATALCDQLRETGRPLVGGWPGTMSEARRRMAVQVAAEPRNRVPVSAVDAEALARIVYATARAAWLLLADRETGEESPRS